MPRHRRLRSMLDAFADDELEPDAAQQVRAHLRTCWWCSGDAETLRLIKAALKHRPTPAASLPQTRLLRFARTIERV